MRKGGKKKEKIRKQPEENEKGEEINAEGNRAPAY